MGPTQPGAGRAFRSVLNLHIGAGPVLPLWSRRLDSYQRWLSMALLAQRSEGARAGSTWIDIPAPPSAGSGSPRCSSPARCSSCSAAGTWAVGSAG
ncbi:MAG: hypothetical protein R3A10_10715 [Caldilineaceae bacterium]